MIHTARYAVSKSGRTISYHRSYTLALKARRRAGKGAKITDRAKKTRAKITRRNPAGGSTYARAAINEIRRIQREEGLSIRNAALAYGLRHSSTAEKALRSGVDSVELRALGGCSARWATPSRRNPSSAGAAIVYIRRIVEDRGIPIRAAAKLYIRERPQQALDVMETIGSHPSSEPELRALQWAW